MSKRIKNYYRERLNNKASNNFLWQVGKTIKGREVSREQIELIIKTIANRLQLDKYDVVLDIGCGNGLLTREISEYVFKLTGIELTTELYNVANKYHSTNNISYFNCDILDFDMIKNHTKFTKVYLYEVIQHLNYRNVDLLFSKLKSITKNNVTIFIGGILDIERQWIFFNTTERRSMYFKGLLAGNDPLGTWYHKDFFNFLAQRYNFDVECLAQENNLYTNHYRFDCLLQRRK